MDFPFTATMCLTLLYENGANVTLKYWMLDVTTALACNYVHTLVDKTFKIPYFLAHKVQKQQLKTNIFNFLCAIPLMCEHTNITWRYKFSFFFHSYQWSSNRTTVKHPLIKFRMGGDHDFILNISVRISRQASAQTCTFCKLSQFLWDCWRKKHHKVSVPSASERIWLLFSLEDRKEIHSRS